MFFDLKVQSDPKADDTLYVLLSLCFFIYYFSQPIGICGFKGFDIIVQLE